MLLSAGKRVLNTQFYYVHRLNLTFYFWFVSFCNILIYNTLQTLTG